MRESLFDTPSNKFKPQYNETIKWLKFDKLVRQHNENVEEWMGRVRLAAVECNNKEIDRQLKEQFLYGLNDNSMIVEIKKGSPKLKK